MKPLAYGSSARLLAAVDAAVNPNAEQNSRCGSASPAVILLDNSRLRFRVWGHRARTLPRKSSRASCCLIYQPFLAPGAICSMSASGGVS